MRHFFQSLGETAEETKKQKIRRPKAERIKGDKKRKSLEKSSEDEGKEEEEEDEQEEVERSDCRLIRLHNLNLSSPGKQQRVNYCSVVNPDPVGS